MENLTTNIENLKKLVKDLENKSTETGLNAYDLYIEEIRKKREMDPNPEPNMETHHIIPKFDKGSNSPENLIRVTFDEHVTAHGIRWLVLGKPEDGAAYTLRKGYNEEARRLLVQQARARDKAERKGRFNSEYQREMGKRSAMKSRQRGKTEGQIAAMQTLGLQYGRQTGMSNQSESTKELLTFVSLWSYKNNAANDTNETYVFVSPKEGIIDVFRTLDKFFPGTLPVNNPKQNSTFYKLFHGERKQMFGWRIVDKLIRSEFEKGYFDFVETNPNSSILLDTELYIDLQAE